MSWLVTAYYTGHPVYKEHAAKLAQSMLAHDIRYEIVPVPDLGTWQANTQYKPTFLKQMLVKHPNDSIVYVDVDAVFLRYPALFDDLDKMSGVNVAVYILDHSQYRRKNAPPEMLSGTIFFKNNPETARIIDEWIQQCRVNPAAWDQKALSQVLKTHTYYNLPDRYCKIWDYMDTVKNAVIEHHQASRVTKTFISKPVVVIKGKGI